MKIRVLGCSGAKFPGHNVPGFLLNDDIVFDAGSLTGVLDERAQLKIKDIFITHAHLDHIRSIPFLADNIILANVYHKVNLYSISSVINTIKKHLFNSSLWPDFTIIPHPDDAILNLVKLSLDRPIKINCYTVTPYKVNHTVPAVGYLVEDEKKRRFFYTGDTGPSHEPWDKIGDRTINCLIIDVSFPNSMEDLAIKTGHLTPLLLKEELLKIKHIPKQICITHQKPQFLKTIKAELERLRIKNLQVLRDGDTIRI
jgi:ribonuclease BN (tRNA processing enzyme)